MSSIELAHEQAGSAFATPTLKMLNHSRAQLVAALLATVLPPGQNRVAAEVFHVRVNGLLDELRLAGPSGLLRAWVVYLQVSGGAGRVGVYYPCQRRGA